MLPDRFYQYRDTPNDADDDSEDEDDEHPLPLDRRPYQRSVRGPVPWDTRDPWELGRESSVIQGDDSATDTDTESVECVTDAVDRYDRAADDYIRLVMANNPYFIPALLHDPERDTRLAIVPSQPQPPRRTVVFFVYGIAASLMFVFVFVGPPAPAT